MPKRDIAVIRASAGGVQALIDLIGELPDDLPAAVFIVVHILSDAQSVLPNILNRAGRLPAVHASEGSRCIQAIFTSHHPTGSWCCGMPAYIFRWDQPQSYPAKDELIRQMRLNTHLFDSPPVHAEAHDR